MREVINGKIQLKEGARCQKCGQTFDECACKKGFVPYPSDVIRCVAFSVVALMQSLQIQFYHKGGQRNGREQQK